ncbi:family 16 glycosylhydrolase [Chromobacterium amazonense]|uniref:family 16 glycosylhydrolase n=2 Tax=Chromobacterium amazonense TaxID=1382803 RepID=UPI00237DFA66|nr:family 16 glycosylhydrolase [Chromobacterium amazonense]MDE1715620.1 family 16 glycosylhydrolase [Chromobacterium amazonense]
MNLSRPLRGARRLIHSFFMKCRTLLPRQRCVAFGPSSDARKSEINDIYVINLDRQPDRMAAVHRELDRILDSAGIPLTRRLIRHRACDARADDFVVREMPELISYYTLADQLFVEPQPQTLPAGFDFDRPIRMSDAEVAVARSHVDVWKKIAASGVSYALVLEDDVLFDHGFGRLVDQAWRELLETAVGSDAAFDVLYLSYKEVRYGAPKVLVSPNVYRPERGLWYLSGYVLSRRGAQRLLKLLPCRGPVDLWINHKFQDIEVRAVRRSIISQRLDLQSTNSYSILPALSQIGILNDETPGTFNQRLTELPVFAFGAAGFGLSSLAMALSMLGYRCCCDLDDLPEGELAALLDGNASRQFNAYVNIASLTSHIGLLRQQFPGAKFIVLVGPLDDADTMLNVLTTLEDDVLRLDGNDNPNWRSLCQFLRLAPPSSPYPCVPEVGHRKIRRREVDRSPNRSAKQLPHDSSPWIVPLNPNWTGIDVSQSDLPTIDEVPRASFHDDFYIVDPSRWMFRDDTFPGNLGLFRPGNVTKVPDGGVTLTVQREPLGVRDLSAASISSRNRFLFGRFEATFQTTNVPGLVTGFFLHRDSPRQEIDVEITGDRPDRLLVNVFYNPGAEGAKYDYGYRGTPVSIPLGFDASEGLHSFAIEWGPDQISWFVNGVLVHRRVLWDPTPIPHLPMTLHVNTWPTRSRELAGRLAVRALPAAAYVRSITVDAINGDVEYQQSVSMDGQLPLADYSAY